MYEPIRQRQPRKAAGFQKVRQFQHHAKVRRTRTETADVQDLKRSAWDHIMGVSQKVDVDRVNWKGIIYLQAECGMFDPTPRLRKR
jgi:hypothetical protein